ncbi:acyl-CoA reductase [Marivirga atlantica]|jgi:hypothetical protein|uniref:Acyl-CoA reductase n=1 Tax=Marivirga atlantica TaxID=1548457 RepID=A0A937AMQ0_9BACT|nr:acyl-CoA reductase [Marivirga atlantica]MBL0765522.1 acyl-CoA reductase [Marivirga atlantica]
MTFDERLNAFIKLGEELRNISESQMDEWYFRATSFNNWFTRESVKQSVDAIGQMLEAEKLIKWTDHYPKQDDTHKVVGLVMAGNIPLVGFHDFLSVLISGHKVMAKISSQDPFLIQQVSNMLVEIAPAFDERITLTKEQIRGFDAVIATGSDNSARYFHQYFGKYPHIIRKNRTSVAVVTGNETEEEIKAIGQDMFQYYGLGCRNVSKVFFPEGYDFNPFIQTMESFDQLRDHHKWVNNYDYNKSIFLVNGDEHFDSGAFLLKESKQWVSPISVIFYEFYKNEEDLNTKLESNQALIQCVVGKDVRFIMPGEAQKPELWDYADGVDTMKFLTEL